MYRFKPRMKEMRNNLYFSDMIGRISVFILLSLLVIACENKRSNPSNEGNSGNTEQDSLPFICIIDTPACDENGCTGSYRGVEFVHPAYIERLGLNGEDVAHQYSNKISEYVGKTMKELYAKGIYVKVDFKRIQLSTKGMGSDSNYVEYRVMIPFKKVPKAQAMTAFDHCGGWGHPPELEQRKKDLLESPSKIVKHKKLYISQLTTTPEGLQEYWIQWRHPDY